MSGSMNHINLYSPDGSFARTVCVGNKLDLIAKIQDTPRRNRRFTFAHPMVYAGFWGVVCWNIDALSYEMEKGKASSVMLFDYEGNPLAEIKFNAFVSSFDIDFAKGELYTLNHQSDAFYKYDIRHILKQLE